MINILYGIPNVHDGCSWYRGLGPLGQLRKQIDINLTPLTSLNWMVAAQHDVLFMLRPSIDEHVSLIEMAKKLRLKVWVDYDDDLLNVPDSNPAHGFYSKNKENIKKILSLADAVTVSTVGVHKSYCSYSDSTIIPNAFPDHYLTLPESFPPRNNIITWRGSNTHADDLETAHEFILRTLETTDLQFVFLGEPDHKTMRLFKDRMAVIPPIGIDDFFETLRRLNPKFHMVPLRDNLFNQAKSNIAWLEATYAGAMVMAPELHEWLIPGAISNTFGTSSMTTSFVAKSFKHIKDNLLLSKVNLARERVLNEL